MRDKRSKVTSTFLFFLNLIGWWGEDCRRKKKIGSAHSWITLCTPSRANQNTVKPLYNVPPYNVFLPIALKMFDPGVSGTPGTLYVPWGTPCLGTEYPRYTMPRHGVPPRGGYTVPRHRVPPGTRCLGIEYPPWRGTPCLGTVYPRYTVPRHGVPGGCTSQGGNVFRRHRQSAIRPMYFLPLYNVPLYNVFLPITFDFPGPKDDSTSM